MNIPQYLTDALSRVVTTMPDSSESLAMNPRERANHVAKVASLRAAGVSGALALPAGPLGAVTLIPDLLSVWDIQRRMVADIAAIYGCRHHLGREAMLYCLFRHGGIAFTRDLVTRVGQRWVVQQLSQGALNAILQRIGVRLSQKVLGRAAARIVPLVGALGAGAYAFYDTQRVARTAVDLFESSEPDLDTAAPSPLPALVMAPKAHLVDLDKGS